MGFLGIIFAAIVILFSHTPPFEYLFVLAIALGQAAALSEYYQLSEAKAIAPLKKFPILFSILYIFLHYSIGTNELLLPALFSFMAIAFMAYFSNHEQAIRNLSTTLFGILYITLPLSLLLDINFLASSSWLVYLLVVTKMTDTSAYFAGKLLGSHRLAPTLSPKKTIEGAIGGLVGSVVASVLFFIYFHAQGSFQVSWYEAILLGALISIVAQIGDLAESLLKRDAEVKDSSTLPGFGGMLDVVDSLLFTTPLLYFWLKAKTIL